MAASIKELSQVNIPEAYTLVSGEFIKEADSFALVLRHKKSGARLLILSNEEENKVFNIGFRTTPKNSTGVPHIIEHTVLCGSKHFPAKDPFVELVKGSLNTFLNAMTYPDKTLYPVASCNDKDFENLMHIYLDAVFYPNIYEYEEIFKQEGWHYELDSPEGELTYNGVVYNEMKGAFSSEESVLERFILNSLFPDNTYGNESGGDPKEIPELSYEEYLDFHREYYHPSNSYIYLYGNMDIEQRLAFLDREYLSHFDKITVDSEIPLQQAFTGMKNLEKHYAVAKDADCSEKSYYAYATAMDITLDQYKCRAFELLAYVLVEMPGAPLKQALLDAGIGSDIDVDFSDITRQSYFALTTKNAKPGQKQEFYRIVHETLEQVVSEGIDRKILEAAINGTEFREREGDFGSYPKGLMLGIKTYKTWLYDDADPYSALVYDKYYTFLREKLETDYYEELIQSYLLDNPHAVLIELIPDPGMASREEEALKARLKAYKDSLSAEEINQLIADTKALRAYQEEPTPKEILEKIPMLQREDIDKKAKPFQNTEKKIGDVTVIQHDVATNDIAYLGLFFHINDLEAYMPQLSILTTLLGYMNTENYSYTEFDTETNFYTGGIASDVHIYCQDDDSAKYTLQFEVRTKVLKEKLGEAFRLLQEMMFTTSFDDVKHLREVIAEARSRLKVRLMTSGHQAAATRTTSYYSKSAWLQDHYLGIGYYEYLRDLDEHFEERQEKFRKDAKGLLQMIFESSRLTVSVTGKDEIYEEVAKQFPAFEENLKSFSSKVSDTALAEALADMEAFPPVLKQNREAFGTPAEIQYVAIGGSFKGIPAKFGALKVAGHLLNYNYLWNEVRVKGGAYGVACRFTKEGEGFFTSYRDPNLKETIDVYKRVADYLEQYDAEEREITKTIIGTISGMDTPLTPSMKGTRSMVAYFTGKTLEDIQQVRDEVIGCTVEDLRALAPVMRAIAKAGNLCVIGNEQHIEAEKELFEQIVPLN